MDKGGVMIPKLDLTSIFIQREALPSNAKDGEESEDESYYGEGESKDDSNIDSKAKKEKFEQQKREFKQRMLDEAAMKK